ncbi:NAD(P)/FAD-dependent oxidoreductase [Gluconobacter sphaericus]|uniref:FAD-dependent oxidoreductase n=1 Tax=Gluconobacter sphaericus TaxID=574987 RepID=UPI001B8D76E0|nr:NAD(P)/FAD-dependent oxidoreductase [Gluconobacter sphaericus]MBS1097001.1 NAD(P)/FAD-dependent oxidoreductase [Gluconobacter sphaericus]
MDDVTDTMSGIETLNRRVREELKWLEFPARSWVPEREHQGEKVHDVIVIGGGMAGLTASGTLRRYGVLNHVVYDMAPKDREGPWVTYARMDTLRSPKTLTGPCLGIPVLTFRAWYEHRFGVQAWETLGLIPRTMWMEYLVWFRDVLELPVENGVLVQKIDTADHGLLRLNILRNGKAEEVLTRKVVLATGRDGLGGAYMPDVIRTLPEHLRAHSADMIDFAALKGKRVVVIGAGASAMDNAATALEQGAAQVDVLIRRGDIPRINKFTGIGSQGVVQGFVNLPDEWKWRFLDATLSAQTPPPRPSVLRVSQHPNAFFHLNCQIEEIAADGDALELITSRGALATDFIIAATGFNVDLVKRPELQVFSDRIRFWKDRFVPAPDNRCNGVINSELANSPDLGPAFEFQPKAGVICPDLRNIHCFCFPATLSHGKVSGDIPAISDGADRLVKGIVSHFFSEDCAIHFRNLEQFETPELVGDEWQDTPLS